jgi:hypothetical protein
LKKKDGSIKLQLEIQEVKDWDDARLGEIYRLTISRNRTELAIAANSATTTEELMELLKPVEIKIAREFLALAINVIAIE